jgi:hypothetical protein
MGHFWPKAQQRRIRPEANMAHGWPSTTARPSQRARGSQSPHAERQYQRGGCRWLGRRDGARRRWGAPAGQGVPSRQLEGGEGPMMRLGAGESAVEARSGSAL